MKSQSALTVFCVLFSYHQANAILDFIGDTARDAAKGSAFVSAVNELSSELGASTDISDGLRSVEDRSNKVKNLSHQFSGQVSEMRDLTDSSNWSSRQLEDNIRYTNRFVQRIKKLFITSSSLGADVATAVNTAEANGAYQEILKNQQTQILMQKELKLSKEERILAEKAQWQIFISREKAARHREVNK